MRQIFCCTLLYCLWTSFSIAQNISNPSFDSIYIGGIDRVYNWITSDGFIAQSGSSGDTIQSLWPNTRFDARGFLFSDLLFSVSAQAPVSGDGASIRLKTQPEQRKLSGTPFKTFITNGNHLVTDLEGYVDFSQGGSPFPYRPTALLGQYQFIDTISAIDNFGKCIVLLKKYNASSGKADTIAFVESLIDLNPTSGWTNFIIPLQYRSTETPDSIVVVFFPSTNPSEKTELWLDNLSFDFTTSTSKLLKESPTVVIYPNPNSGWLYIDDSGRRFSTYRLLDSHGKVLQAGAFQSGLSLPDNPSSMLILELKDEEGKRRFFKVIRE